MGDPSTDRIGVREGGPDRNGKGSTGKEKRTQCRGVPKRPREDGVVWCRVKGSFEVQEGGQHEAPPAKTLLDVTTQLQKKCLKLHAGLGLGDAQLPKVMLAFDAPERGDVARENELVPTA